MGEGESSWGWKMLTQNRYPDLFDWFKHFIGFDEASMELLEKKQTMALEDNRQP